MSDPAGEELNAAILAFLHAGNAASPAHDEEAVAGLACDTDANALVARVQALLQESVGIPVAWDELSLGDAGTRVAREMRGRHPELTQEAADALAWNFTFTWR